jgi:hypothetical protein
MRRLVLLLCLPLIATAGTLIMPGHFMYVSLGNSFVSRTEYLQVQGGREVSVGENGMSTIDFNIGWLKHIYGDRLALRLYASTGSGKSDVNLPSRRLVFSQGNQTYLEYHDLKETGSHTFYSFSGELLFYRPATRYLYPFVFGGGGVNSYGVSTQISLADTSGFGQEVSQSSSSTTAFSAIAGAGLCWFFNPYFGLFGQYKYRYWTPVSESETLVDQTVNKKEIQSCNIAEAGMIFKF